MNAPKSGRGRTCSRSVSRRTGALLGFFCLLLGPLALPPELLGAVSSGMRWEILESRSDGLRLRLTVDGGQLRALPTGESHWIEVQIPGLSAWAEPGQPVLPVAGRWFVLPPEGQPRLRVISVRTETLGSGRVVPAPVPALDPDAPADRPSLIERTIEGPDYERGGVDRSALAQLGPSVFQRRQRMASIQIRPVLYDPVSGRVDVVRELELEVRWPAPAGSIEAPLDEGDPTIAAVVLNPERAAAWRCLSPALEARRRALTREGRRPALGTARGDGRSKEIADPSALLADEVRLRSAVTGIVRLRVGDFLENHGLPAQTPRRFLRIVQKRSGDPLDPSYPRPRQRQVPLFFLGEVDESQAVQVTDEILFFAHNAEDDWVEPAQADPDFPSALPVRADHFNSSNVYFLQVADPGTGSWARMPVEVLAPAAGPPTRDFYPRSERFTGDSGYQDDPLDPYVERYHWNDPFERDVSRRIELFHPRPGTDLRVEWRAGGHNDTPAADIAFWLERDGVRRDLRFGVRLPDSGVVSRFSSTLLSSVQADAFFIADGPLEFHMKRESGDGVDRTVQSFLADVVLGYDALYAATSDVARFPTGQAGGTVDLEIDGFTRTDILLFDITDQRAPKAIRLGPSNFVDAGDGTFRLSLNVPQATGEERQFLAAARVGLPRLRGANLESDPVRDLFATVDDAQILAVGPEIFRDAMRPWLDWRMAHDGGRDWNAVYVDVQQIYDEFSGGLESPWAIKAFTEYAYLMWGARALVLIGDGNEDARGIASISGPNLVPPSLHLQTFSTNRELLASDKWYGIFGVDDNYPRGLNRVADVLVGRFLVSTVEEVQTQVAKILAYEQPNGDEEWRRRTLWLADDAYSTDYLGVATEACYSYHPSEVRFLTSQLTSHQIVTNALDGAISSAVDSVETYSSTCRAGLPCENLSTVRQCFKNNWAAQFEQNIEQGWLTVSYQGHGNFNVLAHESVFVANQADQLASNGKPFVFFGMGCHIGDFLQWIEGRDGAPIAERMLKVPNGGAIASYASSGFEFLIPNAVFMETLTRAMFASVRTTSPVLGDDLRSPWLLGEVMAQGELDVLALPVGRRDEMVSQYNLLGDPLLRLDAAPPRLHVRRGGNELGDGDVLQADPGQGTVALDLSAVDETGIDRFSISDSEGRDYSSLSGAIGGTDPRQQSGIVNLPVYPQTYTLSIATYDRAYPDLERAVVRLDVSLQASVFVDGEALAEGAPLQLDPAAPSRIRIELQSPVDLASADLDVRFDGVEVSGLVTSGSGRDWTLEFDAVPTAGQTPGDLVLVAAGLETVLVAGGSGGGGEALAIREHVAFPNPMRDEVRIVARTEGAVERVRLNVYDLAGHPVFEAERSPDARAGGDLLFRWDGRSRDGSALANGTYLYRLEVRGAGGRAKSEMGRLVIMR